MGHAWNILCTADIDISLQPHGPWDEFPVPITFEDRDSVDVTLGVSSCRESNTVVQPTRRDCKLRQIIVWQMSDVRRNRIQSQTTWE
jgi:hypothetical protein